MEVKMRIIENVEKKNHQSPTESLEEKDAKIKSLEAELTEAKNKLAELAVQHTKEMELSATNKRNDMQKMEDLEFQLKKYKEMEVEFQHFKEQYVGDVTSADMFDRDDAKLLKEFVLYSNSYLSLPASSRARSNSVERMTKRVENYKENSRKLFERCMLFYLISFKL